MRIIIKRQRRGQDLGFHSVSNTVRPKGEPRDLRAEARLLAWRPGGLRSLGGGK